MSDFEADFDGAALAEAWRAHRREGLRHLVVTGRDGATLGTYAGDGAGDAAPPAQLDRGHRLAGAKDAPRQPGVARGVI